MKVVECYLYKCLLILTFRPDNCKNLQEMKNECEPKRDLVQLFLTVPYNIKLGKSDTYHCNPNSLPLKLFVKPEYNIDDSKMTRYSVTHWPSTCPIKTVTGEVQIKAQTSNISRSSKGLSARSCCYSTRIKYAAVKCSVEEFGLVRIKV